MKYGIMIALFISGASCPMDRMDSNVDLSDVPEEMLAKIVDLIEAANTITDESQKNNFTVSFKEKLQKHFNFKKRACELVELLDAIKTMFTNDKAMGNAIVLLHDIAQENVKVATYELSIPALLPLNPEKHKPLLCSDTSIAGKYAVAAYHFVQEHNVCDNKPDLMLCMTYFELFRRAYEASSGDIEQMKVQERSKQKKTIDDCKKLNNYVRIIYFVQEYDKPMQEAMEKLVKYHYTKYLENQATLPEIAAESMVAQYVIAGKEHMMKCSVASLLWPQIEEELVRKKDIIITEYAGICDQERTRILPFLNFIQHETNRVFKSRILPNYE